MAGVLVDQPERDLVERRLDRPDLGEDVDAVPLLLDHPRDPPHLPLDPREAFEESVLVSCISDGHGTKVSDTPGGYREQLARTNASGVTEGGRRHEGVRVPY